MFYIGVLNLQTAICCKRNASTLIWCTITISVKCTRNIIVNKIDEVDFFLSFFLFFSFFFFLSLFFFFFFEISESFTHTKNIYHVHKQEQYEKKETIDQGQRQS